MVIIIVLNSPESEGYSDTVMVYVSRDNRSLDIGS